MIFKGYKVGLLMSELDTFTFSGIWKGLKLRTDAKIVRFSTMRLES